MKDISVFYLDEVENARELLFGLSVLLEGLGSICKDDGDRVGLTQALYVLDNLCFDMAKKLQDTPIERKGVTPAL
ncbi:Uncharacterised protein [Campylobacter hyointestinalis subsp. hyointestinalis]|uniref:Uncharacterized protein n=1 Tax=Campylobacter hyointestinalis subsp. hyointestinalis TaxID=91352 RepID=A0A0S4SCJ1_CAMHY|nr:hypothetical protein [Campylobacter hyointestinalis]CUU80336.1 Uncharacterised protein [Campylobacter hyointestinalis subsp. hyointestinalis]CUU83155.1 Uncharacterised protein [Campylobacter hyointestinalis subsp. hyointestinalis]